MNPITSYATIDNAHPYRLVGPGNSQTDIGLLWTPPRLDAWTGRDSGGQTSLANAGVRINSWSMHNRAGGAQNAVGFGVRLSNDDWIAGTWTDATTTFTVNAAMTTAGTSWPYEGGTTAHSDGICILSRTPFNGYGFDVMVSSSAAPVRALSYWGYLAGTTTAWINFANLFAFDGAAGTLVITATTIANEVVSAWGFPSNIALTATDGVAGTNIPKGYFAIRMRSTTAPSVAAVGQRLAVYRFYHLTEAVADNGLYEGSYGPAELSLRGTGMVAVFDTANNQNRVTFNVRSMT